MISKEITTLSVALEIMETAGDKRLEKLFNCIYSEFYQSFINWILYRYEDKFKFKDKLVEDAKDAFENGILALYEKAKKKELVVKGSLKTLVYSFGLLQLLALFKKDKSLYGKNRYIDTDDLWFDNELIESEYQLFLNEKEVYLMETIRDLPKKQRMIILMKFFERLSSKQIAVKLGVSPGYVDNVSTRVYKQIRKILLRKKVYKLQINGAYRYAI